MLPLIGGLLALMGAFISERWTGYRPEARSVLLCALLGAASAGVIDLTQGDSPYQDLAATTLLAMLVTTTLTEIKSKIVPNELVLVATIVMGAARLMNGTLIDGLLGGALLFGALLVLTVTFPGSLGLGGVKMATAVGILLGGTHSLIWLGVAAVIGLAAGYAFRRRGDVPSSPISATALMITVLAGPSILASFSYLPGRSLP